ncbi:MAG: hypothetical protein PUP91_26780 [Rhizonema sp. PD37]|nr:hypothetical protein [Rhizonema sp. PD37]
MIVVSDTSPITNLAAICQLDLLRQLYSDVIIPQAVYNEMVGVNKVVPGAVEVQQLSWIQTINYKVDRDRHLFYKRRKNGLPQLKNVYWNSLS